MKSETHLYILALVFMSFLWPVWATASEFKMLLRLWPHHHTDDSLKNELLAALEDYPGLWDEAWFFMEYNTLLSEKHNCSARKMGEAARQLRAIGIKPSVQGLTIGHGDGFEFNTEESIPDKWTTIVNNAGQATRMCSCPRQAQFLEYVEHTFAQYALQCKPSVVWLDDDLRITEHWPAKMLCFCNTCISLFNQKYGYSYEAASLLVAMNGNADNGILRSRWIEFSQESLAQVARSVARGVHAVSPETIVGLQHPNFHRELLEGYDWTPVFEAIKDETGKAPASRPGSGFYDDHEPRGMIRKAFDMARQIRRLPAYVTQIAAEIEGHPHRHTGKSPDGLCTESLLYLSMGATQLSYAIICSALEPMSWYAGNYFGPLSACRSFYEEYVEFNRGTQPGGLNPYISPDFVLRPHYPGEPAFGWFTTGANDVISELATLGIPFSPDGDYSSALFMDAEAVKGLGQKEGESLFRERGILIDRAAWNIACSRGFDKRLDPCGKSVEAVETRYYTSTDGARVAVVPFFSLAVNNASRIALIQAADWVSEHRLPVMTETAAQVVVVPRVDSGYRLRSVTVLNSSISRYTGIKLRLRGCASKSRYIWKRPGHKNIRLKAVADGSDVIVTLPAMDGWKTGYISTSHH